jgi:hypothetical protein
MPKILGLILIPEVLMFPGRFYVQISKHIKSERTGLPKTGKRNSVMAATLAKWQKDYLPAGAVIGLSLQNFSWRTIEMPSMKRADMKQALFFELKNICHCLWTNIFMIFNHRQRKDSSQLGKGPDFGEKEVLSGLSKIISQAGMSCFP